MPRTAVTFTGDALGEFRPDMQTALEQIWEKLQQLTTDMNAAYPVEDPLVEGEVWNDSGTLKVSAGPVEE